MEPTDTFNPADLKLSDFLCFAVYSTNLAFGKAYKPVLERVGLTYTQYITIVALWEADNQTVGSLGEKLFLESNTLTPILKKLEAMGYVQRQRDPEDERQVRINLTQAGRDLRKDQPQLGADTTGLTQDEFTQLQKAIVRLRSNVIKSTKDGE
ncbi:MarR family winged helix-turn-helix transcriptional regulator [Pseudomonas sp. NPDC096950]|uniref:MarR family winged helix-turn-helix transcriptional regulator n=1 Tax=Pseudomonas sp. NPDC096950 TaxID=3364485 RepID=UPI00383AB2EB